MRDRVCASLTAFNLASRADYGARGSEPQAGVFAKEKATERTDQPTADRTTRRRAKPRSPANRRARRGNEY